MRIWYICVHRPRLVRRWFVIAPLALRPGLLKILFNSQSPLSSYLLVPLYLSPSSLTSRSRSPGADASLWAFSAALSKPPLRPTSVVDRKSRIAQLHRSRTKRPRIPNRSFPLLAACHTSAHRNLRWAPQAVAVTENMPPDPGLVRAPPALGCGFALRQLEELASETMTCLQLVESRRRLSIGFRWSSIRFLVRLSLPAVTVSLLSDPRIRPHVGFLLPSGIPRLRFARDLGRAIGRQSYQPPYCIHSTPCSHVLS